MQNERFTFTIPEAARMLGISRGTAYQLASRNKLPVPVIKLGKRIVVSRKAIEALLEAGKQLVTVVRQ